MPHVAAASVVHRLPSADACIHACLVSSGRQPAVGPLLTMVFMHASVCPGQRLQPAPPIPLQHPAQTSINVSVSVPGAYAPCATARSEIHNLAAEHHHVAVPVGLLACLAKLLIWGLLLRKEHARLERMAEHWSVRGASSLPSCRNDCLGVGMLLKSWMQRLDPCWPLQRMGGAGRQQRGARASLTSRRRPVVLTCTAGAGD